MGKQPIPGASKPQMARANRVGAVSSGPDAKKARADRPSARQRARDQALKAATNPTKSYPKPPNRKRETQDEVRKNFERREAAPKPENSNMTFGEGCRFSIRNCSSVNIGTLFLGQPGVYQVGINPCLPSAPKETKQPFAPTSERPAQSPSSRPSIAAPGVPQCPVADRPASVAALAMRPAERLHSIASPTLLEVELLARYTPLFRRFVAGAALEMENRLGSLFAGSGLRGNLSAGEITRPVEDDSGYKE